MAGIHRLAELSKAAKLEEAKVSFLLGLIHLSTIADQKILRYDVDEFRKVLYELAEIAKIVRDANGADMTHNVAEIQRANERYQAILAKLQ